jgi:hypothetical protein
MENPKKQANFTALLEKLPAGKRLEGPKEWFNYPKTTVNVKLMKFNTMPRA